MWPTGWNSSEVKECAFVHHFISRRSKLSTVSSVWIRIYIALTSTTKISNIPTISPHKMTTPKRRAPKEKKYPRYIWSSDSDELFLLAVWAFWGWKQSKAQLSIGMLEWQRRTRTKNHRIIFHPSCVKLCNHCFSFHKFALDVVGLIIHLFRHHAKYY